VPEDDEDEQQLEANRRHDQEIHRADTRRVVVQKGLPGVCTENAIRHRRIEQTA
jgi:hypothetical protein